eukprot:7856256-Alexandrium_andersonii.AAC.1
MMPARHARTARPTSRDQCTRSKWTTSHTRATMPVGAGLPDRPHQFNQTYNKQASPGHPPNRQDLEAKSGHLQTKY